MVDHRLLGEEGLDVLAQDASAGPARPPGWRVNWVAVGAIAFCGLAWWGVVALIAALLP